MGERMRALGLMSGTSMDGIDVALLDTDGAYDVQAGPFASYPYSATFREQLRLGLLDASSITRRDERPGRLRVLEQYLTDLHAEAVSQFIEDHDIEAKTIEVIGFHGHTVLHRPEIGLTLQIGDGQRLAQMCGVDVVFDMRAADCAAGGVGAPLASAYHRAMASRQTRNVAVLNIGGVANVTLCAPDTADDALLAFDTGPGNALLDDWIARHTGKALDEGGEISSAGKVDEACLNQLLAHPYFEMRPPKSLDRNAFDLNVVDGLSVEDGAATLCEFSAQGVARALALLPGAPELWIVTGGGRRNGNLMERVAKAVGAPVVAAEAVEIDGDAVEAQAWAYLAVRSQRGLPLTFPGTTGVTVPTTGGVLAKA